MAMPRASPPVAPPSPAPHRPAFGVSASAAGVGDVAPAMEALPVGSPAALPFATITTGAAASAIAIHATKHKAAFTLASSYPVAQPRSLEPHPLVVTRAIDRNRGPDR